MLKQTLKGIFVGFLSFLLLIFVLTLIGSSYYKGTCGFLSEPCTYFTYFADMYMWTTLFDFIALPILVVICGTVGFLKYRWNKSSKWFYVVNVIILAVTILLVHFDPYNITTFLY